MPAEAAARPRRLEVGDEQAAQLAHLGDRLAHGVVGRRPQLERGLVRLGRAAPGQSLAACERTSSARWVRAQSVGSRSMTSSSIPTV